MRSREAFSPLGFLMSPYIRSYVAGNLILLVSLFNSLSIEVIHQEVDGGEEMAAFSPLEFFTASLH